MGKIGIMERFSNVFALCFKKLWQELQSFKHHERKRLSIVIVVRHNDLDAIRYLSDHSVVTSMFYGDYFVSFKGSGTIFKKKEKLNVYKDFSTIDAERLFNLIEK